MPKISTLVLRSLLFIPGNQRHMLEKGFDVNADILVPDFEDSVPDGEKDQARHVTASMLADLAETGKLLIPRVNALDTGFLKDDLAAVVGPHIVGVSVGKIQDAKDIKNVSSVLSRLEKKTRLKNGRVKILPWIESAKAVVKVYEICTASPRIIGAAFGAEDFTHDMAIERSEDDTEIAFARHAVCVAARAAGISALDTPFFKFRDPDGLRINSVAAKRCGFKGKFAIHPAQIDIINEAFSPAPEEIDYARRVVAAFEEAERRGRGSTSLDGKVIDVPVVKRARELLNAAAMIERRSRQ